MFEDFAVFRIRHGKADRRLGFDGFPRRKRFRTSSAQFDDKSQRFAVIIRYLQNRNAETRW